MKRKFPSEKEATAFKDSFITYVDFKDVLNARIIALHEQGKTNLEIVRDLSTTRGIGLLAKNRSDIKKNYDSRNSLYFVEAPDESFVAWFKTFTGHEFEREYVEEEYIPQVLANYKLKNPQKFFANAIGSKPDPIAFVKAIALIYELVEPGTQIETIRCVWSFLNDIRKTIRNNGIAIDCQVFQHYSQTCGTTKSSIMNKLMRALERKGLFVDEAGGIDNGIWVSDRYSTNHVVAYDDVDDGRLVEYSRLFKRIAGSQTGKYCATIRNVGDKKLPLRSVVAVSSNFMFSGGALSRSNIIRFCEEFSFREDARHNKYGKTKKNYFKNISEDAYYDVLIDSCPESIDWLDKVDLEDFGDEQNVSDESFQAIFELLKMAFVREIDISNARLTDIRASLKAFNVNVLSTRWYEEHFSKIFSWRKALKGFPEDFKSSSGGRLSARRFNWNFLLKWLEERTDVETDSSEKIYSTEEEARLASVLRENQSIYLKIIRQLQETLPPAPSPSNDSAPSPSNDSAPSPSNDSAPSPSNDSAPSPSNDSAPDLTRSMGIIKGLVKMAIEHSIDVSNANLHDLCANLKKHGLSVSFLDCKAHFDRLDKAGKLPASFVAKDSRALTVQSFDWNVWNDAESDPAPAPAKPKVMIRKRNGESLLLAPIRKETIEDSEIWASNQTTSACWQTTLAKNASQFVLTATPRTNDRKDCKSRFMLFEMDDVPLEEQKSIISNLPSEVARSVYSVVYSGNKSLHTLVFVGDGYDSTDGQSKKAFKGLFGHINETYFQNKCDRQCSSIAHLTRAPFQKNEKTGNEQILLYYNPRPAKFEDGWKYVAPPRAIPVQTFPNGNGSLMSYLRMAVLKNGNPNLRNALHALESGTIASGVGFESFMALKALNASDPKSDGKEVLRSLFDIIQREHPTNMPMDFERYMAS